VAARPAGQIPAATPRRHCLAHCCTDGCRASPTTSRSPTRRCCRSHRSDLLIDNERQAIVLAPRHLVLARQLHADGLADRLCDRIAASYATESDPFRP
jgi:hypothetical protein